MVKKIVISVCAVFLILGIVIWIKICNMLEFVKCTNGEISSPKVEAYITNIFDENNVPDYAKDLLLKIPKNDYQTDKKIYTFSSNNSLYDEKEYQNFLKSINEYRIQELNRYPINMAQGLKKKIGKLKPFDTFPSFEESEEFPAGPSVKTLRTTFRNWVRACVYFWKSNDPETAFLTAYAILDVSHNHVFHNRNCYELIQEMLGCAYSGIGCNAMLVCASKPAPSCAKLTKAMAKDILVMVEDNTKKSIPLSAKYEVFRMEKTFRLYGEDGKDMFRKLLASKAYKNTIKEYNDIVEQHEGRSFLQIKNDKKLHKAYSDFTEKHLLDDNKLSVFWNPEQAVTNVFAGMVLPNVTKAYVAKERKLAMLELCAIDLAVNSYMSSTKKIPASIEEVETWFGQSLPVNRYTEAPYEIEKNDKYISIKVEIESIDPDTKTPVEARIYFK